MLFVAMLYLGHTWLYMLTVVLCFRPSCETKPLHDPGLLGISWPAGLPPPGENVPRPRQPRGHRFRFRSEF